MPVARVIGSGDKSMTLGRGINMLTVDPSANRIIRFARYDTYDVEKGIFLVLVLSQIFALKFQRFFDSKYGIICIPCHSSIYLCPFAN